MISPNCASSARRSAKPRNRSKKRICSARNGPLGLRCGVRALWAVLNKPFYLCMPKAASSWPQPSEQRSPTFSPTTSWPPTCWGSGSRCSATRSRRSWAACRKLRSRRSRSTTMTRWVGLYSSSHSAGVKVPDRNPTFQCNLNAISLIKVSKKTISRNENQIQDSIFEESWRLNNYASSLYCPNVNSWRKIMIQKHRQNSCYCFTVHLNEKRIFS